MPANTQYTCVHIHTYRDTHSTHRYTHSTHTHKCILSNENEKFLMVILPIWIPLLPEIVFLIHMKNFNLFYAHNMISLGKTFDILLKWSILLFGMYMFYTFNKIHLSTMLFKPSIFLLIFWPLFDWIGDNHIFKSANSVCGFISHLFFAIEFASWILNYLLKNTNSRLFCCSVEQITLSSWILF